MPVQVQAKTSHLEIFTRQLKKESNYKSNTETIAE